MTSFVYVTQETEFDFRPAERFGAVKFLTASDVHNSKNSLHNSLLIKDMQRALRRYDPSKDFIVPVGSPYVQAIAFWVLGMMGHTSISILRWSNRDRLYIPVILRSDTEEIA